MHEDTDNEFFNLIYGVIDFICFSEIFGNMQIMCPHLLHTPSHFYILFLFLILYVFSLPHFFPFAASSFFSLSPLLLLFSLFLYLHFLVCPYSCAHIFLPYSTWSCGKDGLAVHVFLSYYSSVFEAYENWETLKCFKDMRRLGEIK